MPSAYTGFIESFITLGKSSFTHTPMHGGSYYIPGPNEAKFLEVYSEELKKGQHLYFTGKLRDLLPILIDLDFRLPIEKSERQYTTDVIQEIVRTCRFELGKYVDLSEKNNTIVMEKEHPIVDEKNNRVKDGIHIMVSGIVTYKYVQLQVRERCLPELGKILAPLNCLNSIHDIVDEVVIGKNN